MYFKEWLIIGSVWFITLISMWFIPKQKRREASFIFLFAQLPAWVMGLIVVEAGWIEYPVREFSKANATSFTFEFLFLPFLCIFFNLHFPEGKDFSKRLGYYVVFLASFTLIEFLAERYTLILKYIHWQWYTTFITMGLFFYLVRSVYKWFFKMDKPLSL